MAEALGLAAVGIAPAVVLAWYREIVTAVAELTPSATAGQTATVASFGELAAGLRAAIASGRAPLLSQAARDGTLTDDEVVSNAAVALFGGIETTEGMICNAVLCLGRQPNALQIVAEDLDLVPGAVEESLRVEPAAAVVDRYATREVQLAGVTIARRDLVRVSVTAANRDPAAFADPDRFDLWRPDAARHLAFARGPHFCIGAHLARLEAVTAVTTLVSRLPGLRLDPEHPAQVRGLVFRKPAALRVLWDSSSLAPARESTKEPRCPDPAQLPLDVNKTKNCACGCLEASETREQASGSAPPPSRRNANAGSFSPTPPHRRARYRQHPAPRIARRLVRAGPGRRDGVQPQYLRHHAEHRCPW
jgi:hypothetical protein